MLGTIRVKITPALRANRITTEIFRDRQLMSANSAQNRPRSVFIQTPNLCRMIRTFGVTLETRKPIAATFELDRNNINVFVIMTATSLFINADAVNFFVVTFLSITFQI